MNTQCKRFWPAALLRAALLIVLTTIMMLSNVAPALALTWTARTGATGYLLGATYGGGQFVVVGSDGTKGTIFTSSDGATWTAQTSGTTQTLWDVAHDGSQFVAVGNGDTIRTSPDGATWTARTSGTTGKTLQGIAYGGGQFVVVGQSGTILTSPNGATWTSRTSGTSENLTGVVYGGGKFVVLGPYGTILTSSNGTSWTDRSVGGDIVIYNGAYSGSLFVVTCTDGLLYTSPDGTTWTEQAMGTELGIYTAFEGIAYGDGQFVVGGESGKIITSSDGDTWTKDTSGTAQNLRAATYGGGQFVVTGESGKILTAPTGPTACTATGAGGDWSNAATWDCGHVPTATDNVVIPAGATVTLDVDIELGGNLDVQGTLVPNGKTVTLTGDQPQTLKGSPPNMTFYNLVINKTNNADTVTIDGKLKVTKKLTLTKGKLKSASEYGDVLIAADATLEQLNDAIVHGDWTNDGTFIANTFTVTFATSPTLAYQTLGGAHVTAFYNWVISPTASVFLATTPTVTATVTNNGELRQTQTVNNATVNFLHISTDKYRGVVITTTDNLGDVTVAVKGNQTACTNDPTSGPYRNRCFNITTTGGSTNTAITFYTTAAEDDVDNDIVFQWRDVFGTMMWVALDTTAACGSGAGDPCAITSAALELFAGANHFLIGDDTGGTPTALTVRHLVGRGGLWGLGAVSVLAIGLMLFRRRKRA